MNYLLPVLGLPFISSIAFFLGQVSSSTTVPLGEAMGGFVFLAGLVAWIARKLQRIEDDIVAIKGELKSRPCQLPGAPTICPLPPGLKDRDDD